MEFNITDIAGIVSSIGFPIAACIYLFKMHTESEKRNHDTIEGLRKSLDNNTRVMNKICAKLHIEGEENE